MLFCGVEKTRNPARHDDTTQEISVTYIFNTKYVPMIGLLVCLFLDKYTQRVDMFQILGSKSYGDKASHICVYLSATTKSCLSICLSVYV